MLVSLHEYRDLHLSIRRQRQMCIRDRGKHEAKGEYKKVANKEKTVGKTNAEPAVVPKSGNQLQYFYDERI